jgi:transposase
LSIAEDADLVVGADTHRDTRTAAICDFRGRVLSQLQASATPDGYASLLDWASAAAAGQRLAWAIEGTRHYGLGLVRHLASAGRQVAGIDGTRHVGKRRAGKSDPIDAVRAARELLARPRPGQLRADGDREALRLLMTDRDNAVQPGKTARTVLTSVIVTAPAGLREELRHLPAERRARACAALACPGGADRLTRVTYQTLTRLGQRIAALAAVAAGIEAQIAEIVEEMAPGLVTAEPGLGVLSAAQILLSWSHAGRIRSEQAFAMLSGTAPVPVSSGRTDRHRLSDRQPNRALHVIAVSRMRHHPPTLAYVQRRRAEGKTDKEIRRCIKRYLARHLYRALTRFERLAVSDQHQRLPRVDLPGLMRVGRLWLRVLWRGLTGHQRFMPPA